ncbi:hypothetical protein [Sphingomonas sp. R86521]|uniref:hypothetical protein n=1 Tax=Sphingomonas sp. R86521 TaxID=3093860 RepID=UPI0036D3E4A9
MKALLSGQAGLAVVLSAPPSFRPVHEPAFDGTDNDIAPAFAGVDDLEEVEVIDGDLEALDRLAAEAWAQDRAIYRLYMLFSDEHMDRSLESSIATEFCELVRKHSLEEAMQSWLEDVDLGQRHEERATVLAVRYEDFQGPMIRLYPGIADRLRAGDAKRTIRAGRAVSVEAPFQHGKVRVQAAWATRSNEGAAARRVLSSRARPNSVAERRALALLQPILKVARQAIRSFGVGRATTMQHHTVDPAALRLLIETTVQEANDVVQRAGLASDVHSYSSGEIRKMLGVRIRARDRSSARLRSKERA